jgi:Flp pilus assembly protein TadD
MRALPMIGLLALAACANGGDPGKDAGAPGADIAAAALRGGSPQVALRIDNEILAKDPRNVAALLSRGEAQTVLQQSDAAAGSYAQALQIDPASVPARIGLGRLQLADDPGKAEALFLDAVHRDPRSAVAWNDLGIARDLLGKHQDAQTAYRQAIGLDASMHGAQVNLALSMAMAGRAEDAAPLLRPLADAPNASRKLRHDLAAVLAMGGDRSGAEHILAQDLPPAQVDKALSIFAAAGAASDPARAGDLPTSLSDTRTDSPPITVAASAGPVSAGPVSVGPVSVRPVSASPVSATATGASPADAGPTSADRAGADQASAGPASPNSASAALTSASPVGADQASTSLASAKIASANSASTAPTGAGPVTADQANASPISASTISASPASLKLASLDAARTGPGRSDHAGIDQASAGPASVSAARVDSTSATPPSPAPATAGPVVQLATVTSNDAAASEWRRMQKHFPDLLEGRQPLLTESESGAGRVRWNVRTAGFAGTEQAKAYCQAVKAHGLTCFVIGS